VTWTGFLWIGEGIWDGCCEHINELNGYIKFVKFVGL
jgi:hypothetical protein